MVARATHASHPRDGDHYSDRLLTPTPGCSPRSYLRVCAKIGNFARGDIRAESSRGTFKEEALLAEGCSRMRGRSAGGTFIHERPVRPYRAPVSAAALRASPPAQTCGNLLRPFN
jgi:hypothetical protein